MSKEEIIEKVNRAINRLKEITDDEWFFEMDKQCLEALQGLLDLYNKEKLNSLSLSEQLNKEKEKNKLQSIEIINCEYLIKDSVAKSKIKEKIEILEKCTTKIDKKVNLTDYMIIGETERAVGRFVNLDFIKKVLLDEPGYNIELLEEGE